MKCLCVVFGCPCEKSAYTLCRHPKWDICSKKSSSLFHSLLPIRILFTGDSWLELLSTNYEVTYSVTGAQ